MGRAPHARRAGRPRQRRRQPTGAPSQRLQQPQAGDGGRSPRLAARGQVGVGQTPSQPGPGLVEHGPQDRDLAEGVLGLATVVRREVQADVAAAVGQVQARVDVRRAHVGTLDVDLGDDVGTQVVAGTVEEPSAVEDGTAGHDELLAWLLVSLGVSSCPSPSLRARPQHDPRREPGPPVIYAGGMPRLPVGRRRDPTAAVAGSVTTLELFFDLVFVFTVTQLTATLGQDHGWGGVGRVVLLLLLMWWMYGGYAWLTNAAPPVTPVRRAFLLVGMVGNFTMALAIPHAYTTDRVVFAVGYLIVAGVHTAMYLTQAERVTPGMVVQLGVGNGIAAVLILVGAVVGGGALV